MKFLTFFTRTRRLAVILAVLSGLVGLILLLSLFPYLTGGGWKYVFDDMPLLAPGLGVFVTLLVAAVSLGTVAKDAAEDLQAAFRYAEQTDTEETK